MKLLTLVCIWHLLTTYLLKYNVTFLHFKKIKNCNSRTFMISQHADLCGTLLTWHAQVTWLEFCGKTAECLHKNEIMYHGYLNTNLSGNTNLNVFLFGNTVQCTCPDLNCHFPGIKRDADCIIYRKCSCKFIACFSNIDHWYYMNPPFATIWAH